MRAAARPPASRTGRESPAAAAARGRRAAAIVALAFCAGLRRSEIAALVWDDITPTARAGQLRIRVRTSKTNTDGRREDLRLLAGPFARAVEDLRATTLNVRCSDARRLGVVEEGRRPGHSTGPTPRRLPHHANGPPDAGCGRRAPAPRRRRPHRPPPTWTAAANVNDGGPAPEPGVVRRERHRARRRGAVPVGEGAISYG